MSKTFLVAVDGSDHGWKALDLATNLAKVSDAELLVLHVAPYEPTPERFEAFAKSEGIPIAEESARYHASKVIGDGIVSEAEARVRKNGLDRVTTQAVEGNPADRIVEVAKTEGVEMIFLGSRGLGEVNLHRHRTRGPGCRDHRRRAQGERQQNLKGAEHGQSWNIRHR